MRIKLNTKVLRRFLGVHEKNYPDDVSSDKMRIVQAARTQSEILLNHGRSEINIQPNHIQTRDVFNQC